MNNTKILDKLYQSEIDFRIDTQWSAGITARLGNGYNGEYLEQETFEHLQQAILWLKDRAVHHYPDSKFAGLVASSEKIVTKSGLSDKELDEIVSKF